MKTRVSVGKIREAHGTAREVLLGERTSGGFWTGCLSSSALSTATAVSALSVSGRERFAALVAAGVRWLAEHQNVDGGWGDTPDSPSNLATTMLAQAALALARASAGTDSPYGRAEEFLRRMAGTTTHRRVVSLSECYGEDRTFAVPILTNCAIADLVEWTDVPTLPFELARLPRSWFRWLRLQVVSYALPALIAIGQVIHRRRGTLNPLTAALRQAAVRPTLKMLTEIQPADGGFLEATPLTSFVVMSLVEAGRAGHPVVVRGLDFLTRSVRPDGSWPIDTNLATWVTTQAVEALRTSGGVDRAEELGRWLLDQQHTDVHRYTDSPPGGWAWTDLPGGVPDADDTCGALVALRRLGCPVDAPAIAAGVRWLLGLQNDDGGWPTFCRGWGRLPFDRSAADLTAHAVRALRMCHGSVDVWRERRAVRRAVDFLRRTQAPDGTWEPLWFGSQHSPDQTNRTYGTARVLTALCELGPAVSPEVSRAAAWLVRAQNADGGWGAEKGIASTVEETALAVRALAPVAGDAHARDACLRGAGFLSRRISEGALAHGAPIGLYFARLWYSEGLYPVIWSVAALGEVLARTDATAQKATDEP